MEDFDFHLHNIARLQHFLLLINYDDQNACESGWIC